MQLRAYLDLHDLTAKQFAEGLTALGAETSEFGVRKWLTGERTPRKATLLAIEKFTSGAVPPAEFFQAEAAE